MPLKPINIVQAAEADMRRSKKNIYEAELQDPRYEPYAFHRKHARRAKSAHDLILLALMDPMVKTIKPNTKLIYGNAALLVDALRLSSQ